ncbi:6026_t:CDS:2 [Acaulospora colombiana]|uniref:6026_t:CDS:1 n=1 Tax=Acaulospora colombiana TaxID=27376 RepID=A0ACA9KYJ9_9GLOM|nr:6026_t:CDS:2 [Acaulospora colombiana]
MGHFKPVIKVQTKTPIPSSTNNTSPPTPPDTTNNTPDAHTHPTPSTSSPSSNKVPENNEISNPIRESISEEQGLDKTAEDDKDSKKNDLGKENNENTTSTINTTKTIFVGDIENGRRTDCYDGENTQDSEIMRSSTNTTEKVLKKRRSRTGRRNKSDGGNADGKQPSCKRTRVSKDKNAPKKPGNAWHHFLTIKRREYMKDNPSMNYIEINKLLGKRWRGMSNEERKPYLQIAKDASEEYEKKLKIYNDTIKEDGAPVSEVSEIDAPYEIDPVPQYPDFRSMLGSPVSFGPFGSDLDLAFPTNELASGVDDQNEENTDISKLSRNVSFELQSLRENIQTQCPVDENTDKNGSDQCELNSQSPTLMVISRQNSQMTLNDQEIFYNTQQETPHAQQRSNPATFQCVPQNMNYQQPSHQMTFYPTAQQYFMIPFYQPTQHLIEQQTLRVNMVQPEGHSFSDPTSVISCQHIAVQPETSRLAFKDITNNFNQNVSLQQIQNAGGQTIENQSAPNVPPPTPSMTCQQIPNAFFQNVCIKQEPYNLSHTKSQQNGQAMPHSVLNIKQERHVEMAPTTSQHTTYPQQLPQTMWQQTFPQPLFSSHSVMAHQSNQLPMLTQQNMPSQDMMLQQLNPQNIVMQHPMLQSNVQAVHPNFSMQTNDNRQMSNQQNFINLQPFQMIPAQQTTSQQTNYSSIPPASMMNQLTYFNPQMDMAPQIQGTCQIDRSGR